jgi:hypothetical protein
VALLKGDYYARVLWIWGCSGDGLIREVALLKGDYYATEYYDYWGRSGDGLIREVVL